SNSLDTVINPPVFLKFIGHVHPHSADPDSRDSPIESWSAFMHPESPAEALQILATVGLFPVICALHLANLNLISTRPESIRYTPYF
ncbi:MAG: hypothetical protein KDI74_18535, partial [Gammaproteobacteria bacterium]|nr:hypothetical protein [Gammaproteobacteria bacterium]